MKNWNLKTLLIPPLLMAIVFLSWLNPLTRPLWEALDQATFDFLNPWVQNDPFWQNFWAFTGHRIMDWIHDGIMFLFFFFSIKTAAQNLKVHKIAELLFTAFFLALTICLVNGILFPEFIHIPRKSPTTLDKAAFRLSTVIDWITVKDHSKKSFPGDHATTAVLFTCMIFYLMGWRKGLLAFTYAIFFCLPRLITGAHWLTDVVIGSSSIAILMSSLAFGTPLANTSVNFIKKGLKKLLRNKQALEEKSLNSRL